MPVDLPNQPTHRRSEPGTDKQINWVRAAKQSNRVKSLSENYQLLPDVWKKCFPPEEIFFPGRKPNISSVAKAGCKSKIVLLIFQLAHFIVYLR